MDLETLRMLAQKYEEIQNISCAIRDIERNRWDNICISGIDLDIETNKKIVDVILRTLKDRKREIEFEVSNFCQMEKKETIYAVKDIVKNYHAHIDDDVIDCIFRDLEQLKESEKNG